jgi:hypothetical protein
MSLTAHHAKLFAHELTKRSSSDNVDKLASTLSDAPEIPPPEREPSYLLDRRALSHLRAAERYKVKGCLAKVDTN